MPELVAYDEAPAPIRLSGATRIDNASRDVVQTDLTLTGVNYANSQSYRCDIVTNVCRQYAPTALESQICQAAFGQR